MNQGIVIKDKVAVLIILIVFVSMVGLILSCASAPKVKKSWYNPNSTKQEFAKDKYECMQQAQQRKSSATGAYCVGYYCDPGGAESKVVTNMDLFKACMEARDWELREERKKQ